MINNRRAGGLRPKMGPAIGGAKSREECPNRSIALIADTTRRGVVKMSQKGTIFAVFQKLSVLKRQ